MDELLDAVATQGRMDLIRDLAHPLPVLVIAELLGLPREDRERFRVWSDALVVFYDPVKPPEERGRAFRHAPEMVDYFEALFERRRREPGDDLISLLVATSEDAILSREELLSACTLIMVAGNETVTNLIGNAVLALEAFPEERHRLEAAPLLLPSAVEELLRYDAPVQMMQRQTKADCELGAVALPKYSVVIPCFGAANRDPDVFEGPDRLDLRRTPNRHLSFGHGVHFCLGANLARCEARVALGRLLSRFPRYKVQRDSLVRKSSIFLRGLRSLELHF